MSFVVPTTAKTGRETHVVTILGHRYVHWLGREIQFQIKRQRNAVNVLYNVRDRAKRVSVFYENGFSSRGNTVVQRAQTENSHIVIDIFQFKLLRVFNSTIKYFN